MRLFALIPLYRSSAMEILVRSSISWCKAAAGTLNMFPNRTERLLYRVDELAGMIGVSKSTAYTLINKNEIPM